MDIDQDTNTQDTNKYMYLFFISYELCFFPIIIHKRACSYLFLYLCVLYSVWNGLVELVINPIYQSV